MALSTAMPKAMLKTRMVLGLIGMLRYPIRPAVVSNGTRLGTSVTSTIRSELKISAINRPMSTMAMARLITRLLTM